MKDEILTLKEANKKLEAVNTFYKNYLQQMIDTHDNIKVCEMIGVSDKLIFKTIKKGSVMARYRMAKRIDEVMSKKEK